MAYYLLFVVLDTNIIISVDALGQGNKECFSIIHCQKPTDKLSSKKLRRYEYHVKYLHKDSHVQRRGVKSWGNRT